jgi:hypothetical protein
VIASNLAIERNLGRIAADADVDMLAPVLIGTLHLLFADPKGTKPEEQAVRKVVGTVIAASCKNRCRNAAMLVCWPVEVG